MEPVLVIAVKEACTVDMDGPFDPFFERFFHQLCDERGIAPCASCGKTFPKGPLDEPNPWGIAAYMPLNVCISYCF
jgi:hypothetical protein